MKRCAALKPLLVLSVFIMPLAEAANQKPSANAGADQTVDFSTLVNLDGSQSFDSDGSLIKFQWRQTQGPKVKLMRANSIVASFASPARPKAASSPLLLSFKLTVTDNKRATASDAVTISVITPQTCNPPQTLQNGVCITPPPVCVSPQVLQNGLCITPPPACISPQIPQNGVCVTPTACISPQLLKNGICVTPTPVCDPPQVLQNGVCAKLPADSRFNDTGITQCGDALFRVACPLNAYPGQDAEFGRDAIHNDDSDGHAGFSFAKISSSGAALPANASQWSCVKDTITGLTWEVKTDDGGLRDKNALYTNYSAAYNPAGQFGAATDANGFVAAVNAQGLCGARDWRLPTTRELQGVIDYDIAYPGPTLDPIYFPNTQGMAYWSSSPHARNAKSGWVVYFDDGRIFDDDRDHRFPIRLVRGGS